MFQATEKWNDLCAESVQRVALYKITSTESRDVRLESDHKFIVNTKATEHVQQYSYSIWPQTSRGLPHDVSSDLWVA